MTSDSDHGADRLPHPTKDLGLVSRATHHLLGDTIGLADEDWTAPSLLPDWTRGHVATHLARSADAVNRLATWALTGERQEMYASAQARTDEIEAGAGRTGLELQEDLDTACGRLATTFAGFAEHDDADDPWDHELEMRHGRHAPARVLPATRLLEVALHHVDLGIGFTTDDLDDQVALRLLRFSVDRVQRFDAFPSLRLHPTGADPIELGTGDSRVDVSGPAGPLLGWISGRRDPSGLDGAAGIDLPSFG